MATKNPQLPEELLIDIFSRLPARLVGRCRCLSQSWRARLSNSQFVYLHLTRYPLQEKLILIAADNSVHPHRYRIPIIDDADHTINTTTVSDIHVCVDAWMMEEYGLQESWTEFILYVDEYAGKYKQCTVKPQCCMGEYELVVIHLTRMSLFVCNVNETSREPMLDTYLVADGCVFVESLVSPKQLVMLE